MQLTIEQLADKVNEKIVEHFKDSPESLKDGRQSSVISTRRIRDYITKGLLDKPIGSGREKWFDENHVEVLVSLRLLQHNGLSDQYILSSTKSEGVSYETPIEYSYNDVELSKKSSFFNNENKNLLNPLISNEYNEEISKKLAENITNDCSMQNDAKDFLQSLQGKLEIKSEYRNSTDNISASAISTPSHLQPVKNLLNNVKSVFAKNSDLGLLKSLNDSQAKYRQFNEYCVDENLGVFLKVDSKLDMQLQKKITETIKQEINNHNIKENKK